MNNVIFRSDVDVELIKSNSTDEDVAHAAWVSTLGSDVDQGDPERIPGLINYLMKNRHGTPFEHGSFTFRVRCPIFVIREFHRHRVGWSYNEESGRYSKLSPEFYIPARERNLIQKGKPGHYVFSPGDDEQYRLTKMGHEMVSKETYSIYMMLLEAGVAKEVARMSLPLNIYSSFYATCNPRSLMHFLSLRTENESATVPSHPQFEIQMVADKMEKVLEETMPITYRTWNSNGRTAP